MLARSSVLRAASLRTPALRAPVVAVNTIQSRNAHALSNPTLSNLESRWESMPPQEQADLWMQLRERMKGNWHELTLAEKKAAYWIAFGAHGPRAEAPPGETWKVIRYTLYGLAASGVLFWLTRLAARPAPKTMSREWQEASNEYMKENKIEPITGPGGADYKGLGMVQSQPSGKSLDDLEAEE